MTSRSEFNVTMEEVLKKQILVRGLKSVKGKIVIWTICLVAPSKIGESYDYLWYRRTTTENGGMLWDVFPHMATLARNVPEFKICLKSWVDKPELWFIPEAAVYCLQENQSMPELLSLMDHELLEDLARIDMCLAFQRGVEAGQSNASYEVMRERLQGFINAQNAAFAKLIKPLKQL